MNDVPSLRLNNSVRLHPLKTLRGVGLRRRREKGFNCIFIFKKWEKNTEFLSRMEKTKPNNHHSEGPETSFTEMFPKSYSQGWQTWDNLIFLLYLAVPWGMTKLQCIHMKDCHVSFRYRYGGMRSFIGRCSIGWIDRAVDYRTWINLILILGHVWVWLRGTAF